MINYQTLSIKALRKELVNRGITFKHDYKKSTLIAVLELSDRENT